MSNGNKIASRSKLLKANDLVPKKSRAVKTQAVMIYVSKDLLIKWEEFCYDRAKTKSALAREALEMRLNSSGNDYTSGFNAGLEAAADAISKVDAFKMSFPSGKTFADLMADEVALLYREVEND